MCERRIFCDCGETKEVEVISMIVNILDVAEENYYTMWRVVAPLCKGCLDLLRDHRREVSKIPFFETEVILSVNIE